MNHLTAIILFFLLSVGSACHPKQPVSEEFAFNPSPDSVYHFTIKIQETVSREADTTQSSLTTSFSLQQQSLKDSLQIMKMVMERITETKPRTVMVEGEKGGLLVRSTGVPVTYDTKDTLRTGGVGALAYAYEAGWYKMMPLVIGDSLQVTINKRGEVKQVKGYENIVKRIAGSTGEDRRSINTFLIDHVGNRAISDLVNQLFFYLPGKKVQAGDHWVKNVEQVAKAPVKYSNLVTLQNLKQREVTLAVKTVVSATTGTEGNQYVEGELTGAVKADYDSGLLLSGTFTENNVTHTNYYNVYRRRVITLQRHQAGSK